MKTLLKIDPFTNSIDECEPSEVTSESLGWCQHCSNSVRLDHDAYMYVDDCGLGVPDQNFFTIAGYRNALFAGRARVEIGPDVDLDAVWQTLEGILWIGSLSHGVASDIAFNYDSVARVVGGAFLDSIERGDSPINSGEAVDAYMMEQLPHIGVEG